MKKTMNRCLNLRFSTYVPWDYPYVFHISRGIFPCFSRGDRVLLLQLGGERRQRLLHAGGAARARLRGATHQPPERCGATALWRGFQLVMGGTPLSLDGFCERENANLNQSEMEE